MTSQRFHHRVTLSYPAVRTIGRVVVIHTHPGGRLAIDGLHNARDLGGHHTPDGPTRFGAVARSEAPTLITSDGRSQLQDHGLSAYLDLRSDEEAEAEPSPFEGRASYRRVTLLDRPAMERVRALSRSEDLMEFMLAERARLIGESLRTLLDLSAAGGVLIHCRAGKDRTGLVAALLLSNAGVADEVIAGDHARSASNLEPLFEMWARNASSEAERALISTRRFVPTKHSMLVTLAAIRARFASIPWYLRHLGLTDCEVAELRLLLVPAAGRGSGPAVA